MRSAWPGGRARRRSPLATAGQVGGRQLAGRRGPVGRHVGEVAEHQHEVAIGGVDVHHHPAAPGGAQPALGRPPGELAEGEAVAAHLPLADPRQLIAPHPSRRRRDRRRPHLAPVPVSGRGSSRRHRRRMDYPPRGACFPWIATRVPASPIAVAGQRVVGTGPRGSRNAHGVARLAPLRPGRVRLRRPPARPRGRARRGRRATPRRPAAGTRR